MRKIRYFVIGVFTFITLGVNAQNYYDCGNKEHNENSTFVAKSESCAEISSDFINHYRKKETYIPAVGSKEDFIKTIHVSFHIWQRANGTGNLDNTTVNKNRLKRIQCGNIHFKN